MKSLLDLKKYLSAFQEILNILSRHRRLAWELGKRDLTERYAGQVLGLFWTVGHPLVLMIIYVVVFAFVFRIRMNDYPGMPYDYTTYLLSGLIPWMAFQEAMNRGTTSIVGSANLVKQVVFPVELLPIKVVVSAACSQFVFLVILALYMFIRFHELPLMYLMAPLLLVMQLMAMAGVNFLLSSIGVYFRDIKDFVLVFCTAGSYLLPIFYLPEMVPSSLKWLLYINPFSYMIWAYQDVFYFGKLEHPMAWVIFLLASVLMFCGGYRFFRRVKSMFGNVL